MAPRLARLVGVPAFLGMGVVPTPGLTQGACLPPELLSTPLSRGPGAWAGTPLPAADGSLLDSWQAGGRGGARGQITPCAHGQGCPRPKSRHRKAGQAGRASVAFSKGGRAGAGGLGRAAGRRGWFLWHSPGPTYVAPERAALGSPGQAVAPYHRPGAWGRDDQGTRVVA